MQVQLLSEILHELYGAASLGQFREQALAATARCIDGEWSVTTS